MRHLHHARRARRARSRRVLTPDVPQGLRRARRQLRRRDVTGTLEAAFNQGFNGQGSNRLDSWIAIAADQRVTAYTGKAELGQGLYTAQTQSSPRSFRCDRARHARAVRHRGHARPGNHVRQPVTPGQLQSGQPGARGGLGA